MNPLKHCLVGKDTLKGKVLKKTVVINFFIKSTILHYGLNFRGKEQFLITESIIERLDADAVAAKDKLFLLGIPHGNSKHPIKFQDKILSVFFISVHDCFRIALAAEGVP